MKTKLLIGIICTLSHITHAFESETKEFSSYTQLPRELRQIIITSLATYDLPEAVRKIKSGIQVNKEWFQYINSIQGTQLIVAELVNNKKVQSFFRNTLDLYNKARTIPGTDETKLPRLNFTDAQNEVIILILLGTQGALELLNEQKKTDNDKKKFNDAIKTINDWLRVLINIIIRTKTTQNNEVFGDLLLQSLFNLKKLAGGDWLQAITRGLAGNIIGIFTKTENNYFPTKADIYKKIFIRDFTDLIDQFKKTRTDQK